MKPIRLPTPRAATRTPPERRVLALVGNTQVGLWAARSLGRAGLDVFAVCTSDHGLPAHSRYVRGAWRIESGPGDEQFPDEVEGLVRQTGATSIMAIAESYHRALIACRDRFEPEVRVLSPPADPYAKATDKDTMHGLCRDLGVPVARGTTLDRVMDGDAADTSAELTGPEPPLAYPLVLRTRNQNFGGRPAPWKAAYARDRGELENLYAEVRDIASNVLVQEYHPGVEDHIQVLMHEGEPFMVGEYVGEHHYPLAGGVTVQRVSCRHAGVERDAVRLLKAIGWEGIAGVQFHWDPATGRYIFLEINPRFIGGLPTVIMAGFDAPYLLWQGRFEPERMRRARYRLGLRTRIMGGDANWLLGMIRGDPLPPDQTHLGPVSAVARFLWNCGPWTRDDVFSLGDPKPFFVDLGQMLGKLRSRRVDLIGNPEARE